MSAFPNDGSRFTDRFNESQRKQMNTQAVGMRAALIAASFQVFRECQIEDIVAADRCSIPGSYDAWLTIESFNAISFDGDNYESMVFAVESTDSAQPRRLRFHIPVTKEFDKGDFEAVEEIKEPEFICVEGPTTVGDYAGGIVTRYVIDRYHEQMYRSMMDTGNNVEAYPSDEAVKDELDKGFVSGISLIASMRENLVNWRLIHQKRLTMSSDGSLRTEDI